LRVEHRVEGRAEAADLVARSGRDVEPEARSAVGDLLGGEDGAVARVLVEAVMRAYWTRR
jgi:hypothetical protein